MKDQDIFLRGLWVLLFKAMLAICLMLCPFGIWWGVWVTQTLSELKSAQAVNTSKGPAILIRDAELTASLLAIQKDLADLRVLMADHTAMGRKQP